MKPKLFLSLAAPALLAVLGATAAFSSNGWGDAVRMESIPGTDPEFNSSVLDGCPFESPDGLSLFMATDRPGGLGGIDIWRATRSSSDAPWGAPVNLGAPVNSSANDFCPTLVEDGSLFFVSTRPGGCGNADIYVSEPTGGGWSTPRNIGCQANSPGPEFSPSLVHFGPNDTLLFFSSARPGGFAADAAGVAPDQDIYYSRMLPDGSFGSAILVSGVNSAADDARPNVRLDGLEILFDSTRPGGLGGPDIWSASRPSVDSSWSAPVNLGAAVNSPEAESRASLSAGGERLYFGSTRPGGDGGSDIYVAVRDGSAGSVASTGGAILPPNTGDGGLRDAGAQLPIALALAALSLGAGLWLRRAFARTTRGRTTRG